MASNITLSAGVRSNLLSLQSTADLMAQTQTRLATGKKVNTALDNPTNFFTSSSLQSRAGEMSALLDNMSSGIKTLEAADNGISAINKTIESMQSTLRQARQDKSYKTGAFALDTTAITAATIDTAAEATQISFTGGIVGTTPESVDLSTAQGSVMGGAAYADMDFDNAGVFGQSLSFGISVNGAAASTVSIEAVDADTLEFTIGASVTTFDLVDSTDTNAVEVTDMIAGLNAAFDAASIAVTVGQGTGADAGKLTFTADTGVNASTASVAISAVTASAVPVVAASFGFGTSTQSITGVTAKTVDALVAEINDADSDLYGKIRAANDGGKLRIENLSTSDLTVTGVGTDGEVDGTAGTSTIEGNTVRANLIKQFNDLRDQLNKLSDDASFNGVNLLRGDKLKLTFNETGTSTMEIQAKDESGEERPINAATLDIDFALDGDFDVDADIDARLDTLQTALGTLRSQASAFGSNLSIVQNRTEFTKNMVNTLQTGADALVLADTNEEAANMLALQTRQQLSSTALSLASQADQAVLRLF